MPNAIRYCRPGPSLACRELEDVAGEVGVVLLQTLLLIRRRYLTPCQSLAAQGAVEEAAVVRAAATHQKPPNHPRKVR